MNAAVVFRKCTLTDHELMEKIDQMTDAMYSNTGNGRVPKRSIPGRPDEDYDLLVGELLYRVHNKLLTYEIDPTRSKGI